MALMVIISMTTSSLDGFVACIEINIRALCKSSLLYCKNDFYIIPELVARVRASVMERVPRRLNITRL